MRRDMIRKKVAVAAVRAWRTLGSLSMLNVFWVRVWRVARKKDSEFYQAVVAVVVLTLSIPTIIWTFEQVKLSRTSAKAAIDQVTLLREQIASGDKTTAIQLKLLQEQLKLTQDQTNIAREQASTTSRVMVGQLKLSEQSLTTSVRQGSVMQKQLESASRAMVIVDSRSKGSASLKLDGRVGLRLDFVLSNIGNAIASNPIPRFIAFTALHSQADFSSLAARQKTICDPPPPSNAEVLPALFPTKTFEFPAETFISSTDMKTYQAAMSGEFGKTAFGPGPQAYVVGCVDYSYFGSVERHQTGFIYRLQFLSLTLTSETGVDFQVERVVVTGAHAY